MTKIKTQQQVFDLCLEVGFQERGAHIASAIALCEAPKIVDGKIYSDFGAVGDLGLVDETWGPSYGGFQIRSLKAQTGTGKFRDAECLVRPRFNCRAALHIRQTQGWEAWSTYKSGMYKAYLPELFPPPANTYVVVYGDTLSSIGAKLNIDWQKLARINNLTSPYRIYIGQNLKTA